MKTTCFFTCVGFVICSMIRPRKERIMQRLSVSLIMFMICLNTWAGARLPVVDVSSGTVSARAAFGEDVAQQTQSDRVAVAPLKKKVVKKVVARNAKKSVDVGAPIMANDVLNPHRPSSDLWANNDAPLRMPRMEEISVIRSDDLLPEEKLYSSPIQIAKEMNSINEKKRDAIAELDVLRREIAQLTERQRQSEEKIAAVRPIVARTPITGESHVQPKPIVEYDVAPKTTEPKFVDTDDFAVNNIYATDNIVPTTNNRREVVPMETKKDIAMRALATNTTEPQIVSVSDKMSKMSPNELKKAFKKTYLSENKHLSTYRVDERYDVASEMDSQIEGFTALSDLSEISSGIRPLEIKISFMNGDSGLSRDNYTLLSETASIAVNNPKRAIQIAIPESATYTPDSRRLAARRLAIVEQVLRDTGIAEQRIVPVLSQRDDDVFVLRIISSDVFETLTQKKRNIFGDSVSKKTYKSMSW